MSVSSLHDCGVEDLFASRGWRCSKDRHSILELFQEDRPWTLEDLQAKLPHTGIATIYRNIQLFLKEEDIIPAYLGNEKTYYEATGREHHDHKICKKCEGAYCVDCPIPTVKDHLLQLSFICAACKK